MPTNPHYEAVKKKIKPLEQQVCSLELAIKLKQLGTKQKSLFYWVVGLDISVFPEDGEDYYESWFDEKTKEICTSDRAKKAIETKDSGDWEDERAKSVDYYSAFTVAEIGELLPKYCEITYKNCSNDRKQIRWNCNNHFSETEASTMVDAFAEMLIYLIEHNLYDPKTKKKQTTV